jgi:hypothetical protein
MSEATGPRRCRKQGPGKTPPAVPPTVEVLPPTDPAGWVEPAPLAEARARFAAGDFRGCVEPLETLYFARRNTFHQGLLQYVIALHQVRLGLRGGPRRLLRGALELWRPYPDRQEGVDLAAARAHAADLLALLPQDDRAPRDEAAADWPAPPPW